jgi:hypothetical protein
MIKLKSLLEVRISNPTTLFNQVEVGDNHGVDIFQLEIKYKGGSKEQPSFYGELNLNNNEFIFLFNDIVKSDNSKYENLIRFLRARGVKFESGRDNTGKFLIIDSKYINYNLSPD